METTSKIEIDNNKVVEKIHLKVSLDLHSTNPSLEEVVAILGSSSKKNKLKCFTIKFFCIFQNVVFNI
ncbi:hypothetical protein DZE40_004775 [Clostridium beijerinckii]|jgi:hypothetical protein|uniref:Uncharacterized protein n=1 Tax=Clostridium beijerinckii TaxID=1520 RepID=A0A1S8RGM7_CLOBE|nr:hypothetical protein [Clostridium beijerinckii]OOM52344.1 hypothetical protein CLBCK_49030 [Clostridium beijerinckii]